MPLRQLKLLLLLLLMLSHAVASCDSLVVHLPSDAHPLSLAVDSCHADAVAAYPSNSHQHTDADPANQPTDESSEQASHSVHAHVSCFVPYQPMVAANKATSAGIVSVQTDLPSLTLAPPVPPPTLFC
jgi:hypothetical protein